MRQQIVLTQHSNIGLASITVNATPTISISPLGSNSVICSGALVIITPTGATSYTLNPGNQTGTSFTVNPNTTTTYSVDGSNGTSGCPNLASGESVFTVTVNPTPNLNATGILPDSAKCGQLTGGINVTTSNISGGTAPFTYQWYDAGVLMPGQTYSTLTGVGVGTYSLQITDANHCVATVTGLSNSSFTVPASAAIHAQFTMSPNPAVGSIPLAVSFTNTSTGASSYIWSFGDAANTFSTSVNASFTYTNTGTYVATLVAASGACTDTYTMTIIAEIPTTLTIPNIFSPNGDGINDEFFIINTGMSSMNCDIFNRWGQLLHTLTAPDQSWDGITPNGDKAPEGTYMYILQAQGMDGKDYKQQGTLTLVR